MPDILIRMEMPKSCDECPCFSQYDACDVTGSWKFADEFDKSTARLPDCPLVELPPHGDLIDRDAFECVSYKGTEGRADTFDDGVLWLLDQTDEMPVVVPAEREGEP